MNKAAVVGGLVCGLILSGSATKLFAQEGAVKQEGSVKVEADEPEYAFGTVKKVTGEMIVVSEFDYDTEAEKDVDYWLDSKTQVNGAPSVKEIATGDEVDVDYVVKDGKKKAVALSVAKPVEGEGNS